MTTRSDSPRREALVVFGLIGAWSIGAWLARDIGIWLGIGPTAILLGAAAATLQPRELAVAARPERRLLLLGVGAGLLMTAATYVVFPLMTWLAPALIPETENLIRAFGQPGLAFGLLILPFVVAGEEIVWRGSVYRYLERRMPWPATVVVGTALYALAHAPVGSTVLVLACLCAGLCWNLVRWWTGSLSATYVTHILWDVVVLVVFPVVPAE